MILSYQQLCYLLTNNFTVLYTIRSLDGVWRKIRYRYRMYVLPTHKNVQNLSNPNKFRKLQGSDLDFVDNNLPKHGRIRIRIPVMSTSRSCWSEPVEGFPVQVPIRVPRGLEEPGQLLAKNWRGEEAPCREDEFHLELHSVRQHEFGYRYRTYCKGSAIATRRYPRYRTGIPIFLSILQFGFAVGSDLVIVKQIGYLTRLVGTYRYLGI